MKSRNAKRAARAKVRAILKGYNRSHRAKVARQRKHRSKSHDL
jgi:hypothetical protein